MSYSSHFLLMCTIALVSSCNGQKNDRLASKLDFTLSDFKQISWLEGTWTGTGGDENFHEIYTFVNDSTIEINYFGNDSSFSNSLGLGSVYYDKGGIYHEYYEGGLWGVNSSDGKSVQFEPLRNAGTSFSWDYKSQGKWTATLTYRNSKGEIQESIYTMTDETVSAN